MIKILHTATDYVLCQGDIELASSYYKIEQVGEGSNNYKVWIDDRQFVIYNIKRRSFVEGTLLTSARVYAALENYSIESKSFVCYTYLKNKTKDYCAQIIFDDGNVHKDFFFYVSDERKEVRIVQLYNSDEYKRLWLYFKIADRDYAWSKINGYNRPLGHKVHFYGTMFDIDKRQYLWYYDTDYKKFHSENLVRYDGFEEVGNSCFFIGKIFLCRGVEKKRVKYRLLYAQKNKRPITSEEYYDDCLYDSVNKMFQVKLEAGWTLVYYDRDKKEFVSQKGLSYYTQNDFRFINDLILAKIEEDNWVIVSRKGILYSCLWRRVRLLDDEQYVIVDTLYESNKRINICEIETEYSKEFNALNLNFTNMVQLTSNMENEYFIDYYCIANAEVYNNGILGSCKRSKNLNFNKKTILCWVVLRLKKAFVVRYRYRKTYDILFEMDLDEKSIILYNLEGMTFFSKFGQSHSVNTIIDALYLLVMMNSQHEGKVTNSEGLSNKLLERQKKLIESIRECYDYLSISFTENVYEAMSLLFKDKILGLYGASREVDGLLSRLDAIAKDDCDFSVDSNLVAEIQNEMLADNVLQMNIVLEYHIKIMGSSLASALSKVYEVCSFGKEVESKMNEKIAIKRSKYEFNSLGLRTFLLKEIMGNICVEKGCIDESLMLSKYEISKAREGVKIEKDVELIRQINTNQICAFYLDGKHFSCSIDESFKKDDLTCRNRKYIRKDDVLLVFITEEEATELDKTRGCYKLIGEGESKRENQYMGQNANTDIADGKKRILIFKKSTNGEHCVFYDEVKFIEYIEIDDPTSENKRKVFLFELKSCMRFV